MSNSAFIWNYRNGEPIGFPLDAVRKILTTQDTDWDSARGHLRIRFRDPDDYVDVFMDKDDAVTNHVKGLTIARPISHADYLARVYEIMNLGHVLLFYTDETTPILLEGRDPSHFPSDLLEELGTPRFVNSPDGLRPQHSRPTQGESSILLP